MCSSTNPFFVGNADDFHLFGQGIVGFDEGAKHFERGDRAVGAVQPATVGDAVQVGSGEQPGPGGAGQVAEDVQRGIDPRLEARLPDPFGEPAPRAEIVIGPGEPVQSAVGPAADCRQDAQVREQPVGVDVAHRGTISGSKGRHFRKRPKPRSPMTAPSR